MELGAEKPSKRIFERVQTRINTTPDNILHVGDSIIEDVQGALNAGWNVAFVNSDAKTFHDMPNVKRGSSIHELFFNEKES